MKFAEDITKATAEDVILNLIRHQLVEPADIITLYKSVYDCTFDEEAEKVLIKLMPKGEGVCLDIEQLLILMESLRKPKKDKETLTVPKTEPCNPWVAPYTPYPWPGTITAEGVKPLDIRYCCNQAKSPYSIENTNVAGSYDKS